MAWWTDLRSWRPLRSGEGCAVLWNQGLGWLFPRTASPWPPVFPERNERLQHQRDARPRRVIARRATLPADFGPPFAPEAASHLSAMSPESLLLAEGPRPQAGFLVLAGSSTLQPVPQKFVNSAATFSQRHASSARVGKAIIWLLPHVL